MKTIAIDRDYLRDVLEGALAIPSPTGMTDDIGEP